MSIANDIAALKAAAIAASEPLDGDELVALSWPKMMASLVKAGEDEIAAKFALAGRQRGKSLNVPAYLEPHIKRLQATKAAETFGKINEKNFTNVPLPAWVRATLGELHG